MEKNEMCNPEQHKEIMSRLDLLDRAVFGDKKNIEENPGMQRRLRAMAITLDRIDRMVTRNEEQTQRERNEKAETERKQSEQRMRELEEQTQKIRNYFIIGGAAIGTTSALAVALIQIAKAAGWLP